MAILKEYLLLIVAVIRGIQAQNGKKIQQLQEQV